ncbi:hypothetical protein Pla22_46110 [Rubripirellula amarantea]|uniref:Uncharacterized protein n=1 Tax=Rubripirellula amarantea TaxID=2527999 RepID=A0A5C5WH39_9BACT|nr:hypothetical protein [Rubripirellula amarantea]TWT49415.1 hypothetical protein Pla22_46110 [Rubripirellula amarantea]
MKISDSRLADNLPPGQSHGRTIADRGSITFGDPVFKESDLGNIDDEQTLLWIGDRKLAEFENAFRVCEAHVSQIAFRGSLQEAVERRASGVGTIVVASSDRSPLALDSLAVLGQRHPDATRFHLRGPLCEGMTRGYQSFFGHNRFDWLDGEEELISQFSPDSLETPSRTIAVVAANYSAAEPLLDIAEQLSVAAVWCREPNAKELRGVDTVWWDDSFAFAASTETWKRRIKLMGKRAEKHVWITNRNHAGHVHQAHQAGVGWVVFKPYRIERLEASLGQDTVPVSSQGFCKAA